MKELTKKDSFSANAGAQVAMIAARSEASGARSLSERQIDQALVERVQRGDKAAYDLLVLKYQHKIGH